MSIIRTYKNKNFTTMSNKHLKDTNLSWKAKGILSYLLSLPNDWKLYKSELENHATDGRTSTSSGIDELIENGYVVKIQNRDNDGKFQGVEYHIYEEGRLKPDYRKPDIGKPDIGKPTTTKDLSNKRLKELNINNNNKAVVVSQNTINEIKEKTQNRLVKENVENIIKQTGATEEELLTMVELMTNSTSTINNPIGWLVKAIKNGYEVAKSLKFKSNTNKNSFHDFQTSNTKYTNDELLAQLGLK